MATDIKTIFNYMGNKTAIAEFVIRHIPPHRTYIEPFGGTMAILLNKAQSEFEIYNDYNKNLSNLFEIIRTRKDEFVRNVQDLPINEVIYDKFYDQIWVEGDELESAVRYFYIMKLCYMGKFTGGFVLDLKNNFVRSIEESVRDIEAIHRRIKSVLVLNRDYKDLITKYGQKEDVFINLDPPYVDSETYYQKLAGAFTEAEHIKLRDMLAKCKCRWMLSYEKSDLVSDLYQDFKILSTSKYRQSKYTMSEEVLVVNYQPEATLFDLETTRALNL